MNWRVSSQRLMGISPPRELALTLTTLSFGKEVTMVWGCAVKPDQL